MKILKTSWHYKLYCRTAEAWFNFVGREHDNASWHPSRFGRERWFESSNLCFYVRVITVWTFTTVALRLSMLLAVWLALYAVPKALFGLGAFYLILGTFALFFGTLVLILAIVTGIVLFITEDPYGILRATGKPFKAIGSFFVVLGVYFWAKKKKVCPAIEFVNLPGGNDA